MVEKLSSSSGGSRLNRRVFLGLGWLAALVILAARFADVGGRFLIPRRKAGEYGGIFNLGLVRDLPAAGSSPGWYAEGRFWLVRTEAGLLALSGTCTHLDCLMGWDEATSSFVCPCHGSLFAADGLYVKGPAPRSLDRFVIQLLDEQGNIIAETDPQTAAPLALAGSDVPKTSGDAEETEDDSPYARFSVVVDTGRKLAGRPAGDMSG